MFLLISPTLASNFLRPSRASSGSGWLSGWDYRKSHEINPASGAGTDYQVNITVHYGIGFDMGNDVYLNAKCEADFRDIRFTGSDGTSELAYWIDNQVDGDYATVWIKVAEDLDSSPRTIYIYYGNSGANTASNALLTKIAQLREHEAHSGYYPAFLFSLPDNRLFIESSEEGLGHSYEFFVVPRSWINGKYLRWNWEGDRGYWEFRYFAYMRIYDGAYDRASSIDFPTGSLILLKGNGILQQIITGGGAFGPDTEELLIDVSGGSEEFCTVVFLLGDGWNSVATKLWVDWIEINTGSGGSGNLVTINHEEHITMEQTATYSDYGIYHKYVSPEPTHGSWGPEETSPIPTMLSVQPANITDATLDPGSSFSVNVTVADVQQLWGYEFFLDYDTSILTATSFGIYPPFLNIIPSGSGINDTAGSVHLTAYTYSGDPDGLNTTESTPIAWIEFNVDFMGTSILDLNGTKLSDIFGIPITHATVDGFFDNRHVIMATVNINPDFLSLKTSDEWIISHIELPEGFNKHDIDTSSILLNGTVPADVGASTPGKAYFSRALVESFIYNQGIRYGDVVLNITGELLGGIPFEGTDVVFVNYGGDINGDGTIDIFDMGVVSAHWYPGPPIGPLGYDSAPDINSDGAVDIFDVGLLSFNWGQTPP
jgi:hypothetical protein